MLASSLLALALAQSTAARPAEARSAALACPDGGNTLFFKSEAGFQGFRMEGAASYRSLFVGESWEKVDPPGPSGRAEFWLDSVFVQWGLTFREAFLKGSAKGDREVLDAYYRWEYGYLAGLVRDGKVAGTDFETFDPVEKKGHDGKVRLFKIWKAMMGSERNGAQFWVATPHPRGAVVMTLIVPAGVPVERALKLIGSYIANFGSVDAAACRRIREEMGKK